MKVRKKPLPITAEKVARDAMKLVNPALVDSYATVIRCFAAFPELACKPRGKGTDIGTAAFIKRQASAFNGGRTIRPPSAPTTVSDPLVSVILQEHFSVPAADLARVKREHSLSMIAENFVGELLERYLANKLESKGWIWCSGNVAKKIDFVKEPTGTTEDWLLLQIKNRDNTENSSSSSVRAGTSIIKWHRTKSRTGETNWANFPDAAVKAEISERGFVEYVKIYLDKLPKGKTRDAARATASTSVDLFGKD